MSAQANCSHTWPPLVVATLQSVSGDAIRDPSQVANEFRQFYSDLYTSTGHHSQDDLTELLQDIDFLTLTLSQVKQLEAPITTDCIAAAMAHLPPSKALGSDKLPLEFYDQFSKVLIPKLQALYTHIFDCATLPASMGEVLVVLIPKPRKDPLFTESYSRTPTIRRQDPSQNSCPAAKQSDSQFNTS